MTRNWDLTILDGDPPMGWGWCLGTGDMDGDGQQEVVVGGKGAMTWYRPATGERGVVRSLEGDNTFHVGLTMEDIDGDGRPEVITAERGTENVLVSLKPGRDISQPWERRVLAETFAAGAHDICFADVDGDGVREMIANAIFPKPDQPGLALYRPDPENPDGHWASHILQIGCHEEGLAAADLDGDGKIEILSGTAVYRIPSGGPYSGFWEKADYAPNLREMCRIRLLDITGNGRFDVVATDSEYMDGHLAWYENRMGEDSGPQWVEHVLEKGLLYSHSLDAWIDEESGEACIFVGEMARGGFGAPYNWNARLLEYRTGNHGRSWRRDEIERGAGTHEARVMNMNGQKVVIGKECWRPRVQMWTPAAKPSVFDRFSHRYLDRDKPDIATNILAADLNGDGRREVVCGHWWYPSDGGARYDIPGIGQVIASADLDGDGREELIATLPRAEAKNDYGALTSTLVWIKARDPLAGKWDIHEIGEGGGDWPHGAVVAPFLPGGKQALVVAYHDAADSSDSWPELYEVPDDPRMSPWPKRILARIPQREQILVHDMNGNGLLDIVTGCWLLANQGDGTFDVQNLADPEDFEGCQLGVLDVNGNGRLDIVAGEQKFDYKNKTAPLARLVWLEQPETTNPDQPWRRHVIDWLRCPHSVSVADLDGDGEMEVVAGEHDPFWPYRNQCRLYVYKKANREGTSWKRYELDNRFEHHCGAVVTELTPGRKAILSHGWTDKRYVNIWEAPEQ